MTLRPAYVTPFPELDRFLFASIGEEINGVPLSVLSAFSRLGLDPRDEALRLSRLARNAATDQLARMIEVVAETRCTFAEAYGIANTLVQHLPDATVLSPTRQTKPEAVIKFLTFIQSPNNLIYGALTAGFLLSLAYALSLLVHW